MKTTRDMDPDVVRWGLHLLDVCTFSHGRTPSVETRCDPDLGRVEYVREGFCQNSYTEGDEAVARAYQEELSQHDSMKAYGTNDFENEQLRASVNSQGWHSSSNESYNFDNQHVGNESFQNPIGESCDTKGVEDCGRKNNAHEFGVFSSSNGSGEIPATSDDMWRSLEILGGSSLDGEVGKRFNQMVPVPHVPKTNEKIPSDDEQTSDHQRLLDRLQLYQLVESKVKGDGNCQFRSLSDQLYRSPNLHAFVREQVLKQLKSYPEKYKNYVPMDYSEYLSNMSRNGEWGDHVTLQAAADWYGVKIFVITSYKDTCYIEILPETQKSERVIFLSFWAEVHYNSIYPEGETLPSYAKKKKKWWSIGG